MILSVLELANLLKGNAHVSNRPPSGPQRYLLPNSFFSRAWIISLVILAVGILCLVADLGLPNRLLSLFLSPTLSPVSVGAWILAIALAVMLAFTIQATFENIALPRTVVMVLGFAGIIFGLAGCIYTGVLLGFMEAVLAYQTFLLPVLFTLSSLSCGIAIVFFAYGFTESRYSYFDVMAKLVRVDSILIVLEALCVVAYGAWLLSDPSTSLAASVTLCGPLSPSFWVGIVMVGLVIPWILERKLTQDNARLQLIWVSAGLLVGGLCVRLCIVGMSVYDVTQMPAMLYGLA